MEFKYDGVGLGKGGDVTLYCDGKSNPRSTSTGGVRFRIFEPQGQPATTKDNRAWRSLLSRCAVRAGPCCVPPRTKHTVRWHLEDYPGSLWLAMGVVDGEAGLG